MDMRTEKWFAQICISGVGTPFNESGSIIQIMGRLAAILKTERPRSTVGGQEISLLIRDVPFDTERKDVDSILREAASLESQLDTSNMVRGPDLFAGETFEEYLDFLIHDVGMIPSAADFIARDWYQLEPNQDLLNWMADEKAQRFRRLNSSAKEFENALPTEYDELKHYVITTYPQFCESLTFRTA